MESSLTAKRLCQKIGLWNVTMLANEHANSASCVYDENPGFIRDLGWFHDRASVEHGETKE